MKLYDMGSFLSFNFKFMESDVLGSISITNSLMFQLSMIPKLLERAVI